MYALLASVWSAIVAVYGQTPGWLIQARDISLAVTAVIGLITLCVKSPIGKWVVKSIQEDMQERREAEMEAAFIRHVGPVLHELQPNGGSSFRDQVTSFMAESAADRRSLHDGQDRLLNAFLAERLRLAQRELDVDVRQGQRDTDLEQRNLRTDQRDKDNDAFYRNP